MAAIEQLDVRVSGVDFTYSNGNGVIDVVRLRFNVTDPLGEINASGRVQISKEEYLSNQDFAALAALARAKLIERLEGLKEEPEAE
ncbi:hypothetical protein CHH77_02375 [Shouchella clausii]|uniref:hypothetical protein n=1 Tax=Shouchella clausii TaxID=79880 RepID=UPI000BA71A38|nr:hypothetical protein [Shouchella clausii]PAE84983.1 hypothetical protein CHH77_02375 [Shouchella clausii]